MCDPRLHRCPEAVAIGNEGRALHCDFPEFCRVTEGMCFYPDVHSTPRCRFRLPVGEGITPACLIDQWRAVGQDESSGEREILFAKIVAAIGIALNYFEDDCRALDPLHRPHRELCVV